MKIRDRFRRWKERLWKEKQWTRFLKDLEREVDRLAFRNELRATMIRDILFWCMNVANLSFFGLTGPLWLFYLFIAAQVYMTMNMIYDVRAYRTECSRLS